MPPKNSLLKVLLPNYLFSFEIFPHYDTVVVFSHRSRVFMLFYFEICTELSFSVYRFLFSAGHKKVT